MSLSTEDDLGQPGYSMNFMRAKRSEHLCNRCNNFDLHSFGRDPFGFRGYKYSDLEEAAGRGCSFCSVLLGSFKDNLRSTRRSLPTGWEKSWWVHLRVFGVSEQQDIESGGTGLGIYAVRATLAFDNYTLPAPGLLAWMRPRGTFPSRVFHIVADANSQAARNNDVRGRYKEVDVYSGDNIRIIYNWLQTCLEHPKCCQTMSGERSINARQVTLPTRCIEILERGFRLKETSSEKGSYITLSHRWVPDTTLCCTTAENIDSRSMISGNWARDLPIIFHDVIDLARRLAVKYVWIDSLCIIQAGDDGVDWRRESIRMADYYQNSLLTIAATSGSKDFGLIPPKTILPPKIARLPYRDSKGSRHGYFYAYSQNWEVDRQYLSFVQGSELLSRGWVFQEWLLSRRIVYFTPAGIFFECEETPYNELGEVPQTRQDDGQVAAVQPSAKKFFTLEAATINPVWYRIVESYSALSLTKPDMDRIIALAGVAKEFRQALMRTTPDKRTVAATVPSGLEFVSGLWLPDLHHGLLWESKSSECEPKRIPKFPTWSWTSILCPVTWDDGNGSCGKPAAKLVAVATSLDDVFPVDSLRSIEGCSLSPPRVFDIDNYFASLYMTGKTSHVTVRERFNNERNLEIASAASGHSVKSSKKAWRVVCSSLLPTEIIGWASFEHPDYQADSLFEDGCSMCVFHITTASVEGGYGLGYLTPWHYVFNVLFVRNIDGQKFERLGVGRLFGKEIEKKFATATAQYVELN